jgi:hypothetical protein
MDSGFPIVPVEESPTHTHVHAALGAPGRPTQPDLSGLIAFYPTAQASQIHLHLPGYQPGKKARSMGNAPLCGGFVHMPADTDTSPLAEALSWPQKERRGSPAMTWCPKCIGHLTVIMGAEDIMVRRAIALASDRWLSEEE